MPPFLCLRSHSTPGAYLLISHNAIRRQLRTSCLHKVMNMHFPLSTNFNTGALPFHGTVYYFWCFTAVIYEYANMPHTILLAI